MTGNASAKPPMNEICSATKNPSCGFSSTSPQSWLRRASASQIGWVMKSRIGLAKE